MCHAWQYKFSVQFPCEGWLHSPIKQGSRVIPIGLELRLGLEQGIGLELGLVLDLGKRLELKLGLLELQG